MRQKTGLYDWTGSPLDRPPDRIAPSVSAVILNAEGQLLLHRRSDNGHWALPGGRIEIGESVEQAIVREVREETGLHVRVENLIGVYSDPDQYAIARYPNGDVVHYINLCFRCHILGGTLQKSDESFQVCFFPLDALPDPLLWSHRIRIRDAMANRCEAFIR